MLGGTGNDSLYGGAGNDSLNGQTGIDYLYGGAGDDLYVHNLNSGIDYINDNQTVTGATGLGGGRDTLQFTGVSINDIWAAKFNTNDLLVYTTNDTADGVLNDYVMIQNYFLGGNYKIELVAANDGIPYIL